MLISTIISNGRLLSNIPNTIFYTDSEALFAAQIAWKDLYSFLCQNNDDYFVTKLYFTPTSTVTAGAFSIGSIYKIEAIGTTDFTLIGASANVVGVVFTATGPGAGTGTAYSFVSDANRQYMSTQALPINFYRLRLLQYQGSGVSNFNTVSKMTIENFGNSASSPSYRFVGNNLEIFDRVGYLSYALWYYPSPATLTLGTDLDYPLNMIPEYIAYQVAIPDQRPHLNPFQAVYL